MQPGEAMALLSAHGCIEGQTVGLCDESGNACLTLAAAHPEIRRGYEYLAGHFMARLSADKWGEYIVADECLTRAIDQRRGSER